MAICLGSIMSTTVLLEIEIFLQCNSYRKSNLGYQTVLGRHVTLKGQLDPHISVINSQNKKSQTDMFGILSFLVHVKLPYRIVHRM